MSKLMLATEKKINIHTELIVGPSAGSSQNGSFEAGK
jgi:hypothetical protein